MSSATAGMLMDLCCVSRNTFRYPQPGLSSAAAAQGLAPEPAGAVPIFHGTRRWGGLKGGDTCLVLSELTHYQSVRKVRSPVKSAAPDAAGISGCGLEC
jgi:hypothetical protein